MLIEDSFTVRTPVDRLWAFIQDVERIAPCMPGAELTEVVDDRTWKGKVHVKFGPVQMAFSGTVVMEERDDAAHRAKLSAKGTEQRGKGVANAKVESWLEPAGDEGTTVHIRSDITITGAAAQMSRGLLPEVSKLLTKQFADLPGGDAERGGALVPGAGRRRHRHDERARAGDRRRRAAPKPVGGFGLGLRALWATIARFFSRLFGRRDRSVISGIVLAAGAGRRFGGTKQLASPTAASRSPSTRRRARLRRCRRARRRDGPRRGCGRASAPAPAAGPLRPEPRPRDRPVILPGRRPARRSPRTAKARSSSSPISPASPTPRCAR